ncbi:hypothetical protein BLJAPNOD_05168 [Ensifer sp. M14]|uniref:SRPBCC family protein n=1 Tax=Ensifer sp. M14 TaxID=2203782 RepID=UPI000E1D4C25|nr:SRPBCC family protein [Ensifer sp. M14]RDL47942.1 hypothetical protein BLJAPNOD_05168 [Ensifer sp. M14]
MAKAHASAVIDAPIETVWKIVRDFNGLPNWHPAIARSEIEGGLSSAEVGCIRSFYLTDGAHVREQLLALSDIDHSLSYSFVKPAFPIKNYVAAIRLIEIGEGDRTLAEWTAVFDEEPEDAGKYVEIVSTHVFAAGWAALQAKLAS